MKLSPEELETNCYELIETLEHKELVPFVKKFLYRYGFWPLSYFGFVVAMLLTIGALAGYMIAVKQNILLPDILGKTFLGCALSFLLIPLHEYIHAIAYRVCGAREVSYDADLKKMVFMAIAHRFVAGSKEFRFVAIAPFSAISIIAFTVIPFLGSHYIFTALGLIFMHAAFCGGDFAMLSYLDLHKDKEVVTWDDKENKVTYFYGKSKIG